MAAAKRTSKRKGKGNQTADTSASKADGGSGVLQHLVVAALALAVYVTSQNVNASQFVPPPAATKPFDSFDSFFPFYLTEHSDQTCRRLHVVGTGIVCAMLVVYPSCMMAMATAAIVGLTAQPWLMWQTTGIVEASFMLGTYLLLGRKWTRQWLPVLLVPLCGYGFAWVGHFYFEQNKPATFIYPTFSLLGDFRLFYHTITGTLPW